MICCRRVSLALGLADDLQDLVERIEDFFKALEDVDALLDRLRARARAAWSRLPA